MNKIIISLGVLIIFSLIFSAVALAKDFELPEAGIAPDSPFYFLKSWKEQIQLFLTFKPEQKAKQYLHLAGVRLAEYQKMLEKGKTEIAEKTLTKYENQLNRALSKAEELKDKGKNVEELTTQIQEATSKHLEVLQQNLQKVPEQAKKGIENAIENSQKQIEKVLEKSIIIGGCTEEAKICPNGSAVGRTGPNCEFAECPKIEEKTEKKTAIDCGDLDVLNNSESEIIKITTCFDENFKKCRPAKFTISMHHYYEIIGQDDNSCLVKLKYLRNQDHPEWIGKEMICKFDNTGDFKSANSKLGQDIVKNINVCKGELYNLIIK